MTVPITPPRLAAIDRIETVLKAIVEGADYWHTPGAVLRKFIFPEAATAFPTYMISTASEGTIGQTGPNEYTEEFHISIKCYVRDFENTTKWLEECIADIRKAVDRDSRSGAVGTLGQLGVETIFDTPPDTDDGYLSADGLGFFDMRVRIRLAWRYGTL